MKAKLIEFPEIILDTLDEYKQKTGISSTDYIRRAVVKQMIVDGLIFFKTKFINVEENRNGNSLEKINQALPEEIKFCDGDSCEVSPDYK